MLYGSIIYCGKQAFTVNNQIHCHLGYNNTKHQILLGYLFTEGNVDGGLSFYIFECYWALLFNSCLHCMYIIKCAFKRWWDPTMVLYHRQWWEFKYICSINFLKNTKDASCLVCGHYYSRGSMSRNMETWVIETLCV